MMLDKNVNVITQNYFVICSLTMLYSRILADTGVANRSEKVLLELMV